MGDQITRQRHGTTSGFSQHQRNHEEPCESCRRAKSEYDKRRLAAPELTIRNRLHAKAQGRALRDLKHNHPKEYREFYQAHMQELTGE